MSTHIVHYKGFKITYENGIYKVVDLPGASYFNLNVAMVRVDEYEDSLIDNILNEKPSNEKTTNSD